MNAPAQTSRGMRWWTRLLVVLAFDGAVLALAWSQLDLSPARSVEQAHPVLAVVLAFVLGLTLVLSGPGRWPLVVHGVFLMLCGLAFFWGPGGLVAAYRWVAQDPVPVTATAIDADGTLAVRAADGDTFDVYRTGDDGIGALPAELDVWVDPAGLVTASSTAPDTTPLAVFVALAGLVPLLVLQVDVAGVLLRRGPSVVQRYGSDSS